MDYHVFLILSPLFYGINVICLCILWIIIMTMESIWSNTILRACFDFISHALSVHGSWHSIAHGIIYIWVLRHVLILLSRITLSLDFPVAASHISIPYPHGLSLRRFLYLDFVSTWTYPPQLLYLKFALYLDLHILLVCFWILLVALKCILHWFRTLWLHLFCITTILGSYTYVWFLTLDGELMIHTQLVSFVLYNEMHNPSLFYRILRFNVDQSCKDYYQDVSDTTIVFPRLRSTFILHDGALSLCLMAIGPRRRLEARRRKSSRRRKKTPSCFTWRLNMFLCKSKDWNFFIFFCFCLRGKLSYFSQHYFVVEFVWGI